MVASAWVLAILFSSPVFVMLFSICILKERCGLFRVWAGASLLGGVVMITKPPIIFGYGTKETYDFTGYVLVCLACLMSALGIVLTKEISQMVEKTVILFYLGLSSAVCGAIGLFSVGTASMPAAWEWGLALGIGILGLVQQYCLIYAVTLESPSTVTIIRQMQIILAYIVQAVMFHVMPSSTDILGASLILTTVVAVSFEEQISIWFGCPKESAEGLVRRHLQGTQRQPLIGLDGRKDGAAVHVVRRDTL